MLYFQAKIDTLLENYYLALESESCMDRYSRCYKTQSFPPACIIPIINSNKLTISFISDIPKLSDFII